jgi:hypothetical protein
MSLEEYKAWYRARYGTDPKEALIEAFLSLHKVVDIVPAAEPVPAAADLSFLD